MSFPIYGNINFENKYIKNYYKSSFAYTAVCNAFFLLSCLRFNKLLEFLYFVMQF